jgi:hypothetical protein
MTLEKYFSQVTVIDKPNGAKEAVVTEKILIRETKKDPRQQSAIPCYYPLSCSDRENGFCYFKGKWCSGRVKP